MFLGKIFLLFLCVWRSSSEPIELTSDTWKEMLQGQWMVEFYAPWCPACQNFKSVWNDFSKAMKAKKIEVAAIDVDRSPSLSGRFRIAALPTVYYVRDGLFRQYSGERTLKALKSYIENEEWQQTEPVSSYFAPDSFFVSGMSTLFDLSLVVKNAYTVLEERYAWPAWVIYIVLAIGVALAGLALGFGVIFLVDNLVGLLSKISRKSRLERDFSPSSKAKEETDAISSDITDEESSTSTDQTVRQRRAKN